MNDTGVARVHFYPKQYLGAQDFEDEQRYHLARLRQHQLSHHSFGIVRGLELALNQDKTGLMVRPGVAVDGYGRLLVLGYDHELREEEFDHRGSNVLDVWLVYALQEADSPRPGSVECDPDHGQAGASGENGSEKPFIRWQEEPVVRLTVPNSANPVAPRQPEGVPQSDWDFAPTRTPPDSPLDAWPVYLGRATRSQEKPPRGPYTYTPNLTGRPYAGLVGEVIRHPAGRAWVQLGQSQVNDQEQEDIRFAVFIENPAIDHSTKAARLEIDKEGNMTVRGPTTVEGDIVVSRGRIALGAGKAYSEPQAWHLYRVASTEENGKPTPEQWRLELDPGGEFSVGSFSSQEKKYKDCIRVRRPPSGGPRDTWTVSIDGDLHVTGLIRESVLVPPELAIQAKTLLTQSFMAPLFGQAITYRPVSKKPPFDLNDVQNKQQIALLARQVFETNPNLARDLAVTLVKQDASLALAREVAVAVTELIKPENPEAVAKVKGALEP